LPVSSAVLEGDIPQTGRCNAPVAYFTWTCAVRRSARPKLVGPQVVSGTTAFAIKPSKAPPAKVGMNFRVVPG